MGSKNVIGELLERGEVGTQAELARRAQVAKSTVSEAANGRGMGIKAAHKMAPPLGVDGDVLYGAVNLAAALKALDDGGADESETLERIGRIVRTLGQSDADEDAEGMDAVLSAIEDALDKLSGAAVQSVRGSKAATKNAGMHAAFKAQMDRAGTAVPRAEDYDVDDSRDLYGRKLDTGDLGLEDERGFPDAGSFDTSNQPMDAEDDYPTDAYGDGRDLFGRRTRPFESGR